MQRRLQRKIIHGHGIGLDAALHGCKFAMSVSRDLQVQLPIYGVADGGGLVAGLL